MLKQFRIKNVAVGLKTYVVCGDGPLRSPIPNEYTLAKSL